MVTLTAGADGFLRDGRPHQIISGAVHYFRIHPDQWTDRLERLRALGLNTVETYVAWNFHEPEPGRADFTGWRDLPRFVELAAGHGFDVIVRPGPYICAEWEFGGLPAWLLADPEMRLRCSDPRYLAAVDRWFDALVPRLTPLLADAGGPIVATQVENEYGHFGDDETYLAHLRDGLRARGITGLLVTSDGPAESMLAAGMVDGALATANFGSRHEESFAVLHRFQPTGPTMVMEYWNGWFDHWREGHHVRDADSAASELDAILSSGASVNIYMAHGGTNFGLWNGANCHDGVHEPTITSYDYDAPISESGALTEKYHRYRDVIAKFAPVPDTVPDDPKLLSPRSIRPTEGAALLDQIAELTTPVAGPTPLSMEAVGQSTGLIHYRARVRVPSGNTVLTINGLRDRAQVFLDGKPVGTLHRNEPSEMLTITGTGDEVTLDVLVENQGRTNFGPDLADRKGILGGVLVGLRYVFGWATSALPLDDLGAVRFGPTIPEHGPAFHRATVEIDDPADAFLALPGWTKGFVWLNGFLLGRYWNVGPQRTLYAPAPVWRAGTNEIVVLELHDAGETIELVDEPDLGPPTQQQT